MTDPLAAFVRAEREALLQVAPAPHAARLWHEARRRSAAALRRGIGAAGWLVRITVAAAMFICFLSARPEADFLFLLCVLSIWLTRGACASSRRDSRKGIME